jgi:hypothetical protein
MSSAPHTTCEASVDNASATSARLAAGRLIQPCGYFRQKAKRLKPFVKFLDASYHGSLDKMFSQANEKLRAELLALNGVGPETADSNSSISRKSSGLCGRCSHPGPRTERLIPARNGCTRVDGIGDGVSQDDQGSDGIKGVVRSAQWVGPGLCLNSGPQNSGFCQSTFLRLPHLSCNGRIEHLATPRAFDFVPSSIAFFRENRSSIFCIIFSARAKGFLEARQKIKSPNGGRDVGEKGSGQKPSKTSLTLQSFVGNIHRMFPSLCPWY